MINLEFKERNYFTPSFKSWIISFIAIISVLILIIDILFAYLILVNTDLRNLFLHWAITSLVVAYFLYKFVVILFIYTPSKIIFEDKMIMIRYYIRSKLNIEYNDILHIEINKSRINLLFPVKIKLFTTDRVIILRPARWRDQNKIIEIFTKLQKEHEDIFVRNFHYKHGFYDIIKRILSTGHGKIALTFITIFTIFAIVGAMSMAIDPPSALDPKTLFLRNPEFPNYSLPGYDYSTAVLHKPSKDFWFGTDFAARDIFSRLIFGTTVTFYIAIIGASLAIFFMVSFGLSTAVFGGVWDNIVTRISDVLMTFPWVVWLILISTFSGPIRVNIIGGFYFAVYTGMAFVTWPYGARLLRSEIREILGTEYVAAVDLVGASKLWIVKKHVIPKIIPTLLFLFAYQMSEIIIGISLLGYIGYGSESTIVWGSELSHAMQSENISNEWWTIVFPSLFIILMVLSLNLLSDSLRDIYESKFRGGHSTTLYSSIGGKNKK